MDVIRLYPLASLVTVLVFESGTVSFEGAAAVPVTGSPMQLQGCDLTPRRVVLTTSYGQARSADSALCVNGTPDLNGDGIVGGPDFGLLAAQWGGSGSADLNGDGVVGGPDLAVFASVFGARVRP